MRLSGLEDTEDTEPVITCSTLPTNASRQIVSRRLSRNSVRVTSVNSMWRVRGTSLAAQVSLNLFFWSQGVCDTAWRGCQPGHQSCP